MSDAAFESTINQLQEAAFTRRIAELERTITQLQGQRELKDARIIKLERILLHAIDVLEPYNNTQAPEVIDTALAILKEGI